MTFSDVLAHMSLLSCNSRQSKKRFLQVFTIKSGYRLELKLGHERCQVVFVPVTVKYLK